MMPDTSATTNAPVIAMKPNLQLAKNVLSFIDRASADRALLEEERFNQEMFANCFEVGMESPIEHLFWVAVAVQCHAEYTDFNPGPEDDDYNKLKRGIYLQPQIVIGDYRVDFVLSQVGIGPRDSFGPVVVELDGHDFHDKDKRQRSYEKARDRHLTKAGYRVLHFTGSDVCRDPYSVAFESLELLGLFTGTRAAYDPKDPLGRGI